MGYTAIAVAQVARLVLPEGARLLRQLVGTTRAVAVRVSIPAIAVVILGGPATRLDVREVTAPVVPLEGQTQGAIRRERVPRRR